MSNDKRVANSLSPSHELQTSERIADYIAATSRLQHPRNPSYLRHSAYYNDLDLRFDIFLLHWEDLLDEPVVSEMYAEFIHLRDICKAKAMKAKDILERFTRNHEEWCESMQMPSIRIEIDKRIVENLMAKQEEKWEDKNNAERSAHESNIGDVTGEACQNTEFLGNIKDMDLNNAYMVTFEEVRITLDEYMCYFYTETSSKWREKWHEDIMERFKLGIVQTIDPGSRTPYDIQADTFLDIDGILLAGSGQRLPRPEKIVTGFSAATEYLSHVLIRHLETHPNKEDQQLDNHSVAGCINGILMLRNPRGRTVQEIIQEVLSDIECARLLEERMKASDAKDRPIPG